MVSEKFFSNEIFRGRGLTARFLYCLPESMVGRRRYDSQPADAQTYRNYAALIRDMLEDPEPAEPEPITISEDADQMLREFSNEMEPMMIKEYAEIAEWVKKAVVVLYPFVIFYV